MEEAGEAFVVTLLETNPGWTEARNSEREQVWPLVRPTQGQAADSPGHAKTGQFWAHSTPR